LFDIYRAKPTDNGDALTAPRKSLAIRLVFGSDELTLTDEQTDEAVASVRRALEDTLGATLRA